MHRDRLLIVDDEEDMLAGLSRLLSIELEGVEIQVSSSPEKAIRMAREELFGVVLLDVRMPEMDGIEALKALRQVDPWLTIVMMTAYGSIEVAVEAIRLGAYDFLTKPFDREVLLRLLNKAFERNHLIRENLHLQQRARNQDGIDRLVGQSLPMRRLFEQVTTIAASDYTVLIRGQSGTGKELVARALHGLSKRNARPMVTVNCPAIPEHLLESELFGHKRGAFTGADRDQPGLFREADRGTLFLDEIADIPVSIQTKLLRVLQEHEVRALGTSRTDQVDVRILASTNQNLEQKIEQKTFRDDLFYRLNVVSIWTPSLQEIQEDIPLLAAHFLKETCSELGIGEKRLALESLQWLRERSWPGNVRQLQHFIRRLVMFCPNDLIRPEDVRAAQFRSGGTAAAAEPLPVAGSGAEMPDLEPYKDAKNRVLTRFTRDYVQKLLDVTGGNVTRAADLSGLTRAALQKILRRLNLNSTDFKG